MADDEAGVLLSDHALVEWSTAVAQPLAGPQRIGPVRTSGSTTAELTGAILRERCAWPGAVYALQLSLYQYILERVYGFRCGDRVLLTLHPSAPEYATAVPYLKEEVELLMQRRIALVAARRRAVEGDPGLACGLTGAPAHDAVTLRDGRTASEKAALVRELPYEPDEPTRKRFRESVDALLEEVPPPAKWTKGTWRRRMPERGLAPFVSFC